MATPTAKDRELESKFNQLKAHLEAANRLADDLSDKVLKYGGYGNSGSAIMDVASKTEQALNATRKVRF